MDSMKVKQIECAQVARVQAKTYETLGNIFNERPDTKLVCNIKAIGVDFLTKLCLDKNLNREAQTGLSEISQFMKQIIEQPAEDVERSLQVDWTRLFRGIQPGYGPIPPYEGLYTGESENNLKALEDVACFYSKHGVLPNEKAGNRPDYIGLELDFLRYVCEQQAESWQKGDETEAQKWQLAEYEFLRDHLGRWAAVFCDRAIEEAKTKFYRGFAYLTKGIIEEMANAPRPAFIGTN